MSPLENELIVQSRQIVDDTLREVVIKQVKAMGEFDPTQLVIDQAPIIAEYLDWEDEIIESLRKRSKK